MSDATRPGPVSQGQGQGQEQRANWFELFFDLVFVATLYVMAHELRGDPSPADFGAFLILFFPAWWGWVNLMMTVNVFGPANPRALAMLVAAVPGFGLMAAASPEGLGDRAWAYALGAAWVRLVHLPLWWGRTHRGEALLPWWQPLLYGLLPAALWAASAAVPGAGRFVLWAVAVGLEILLLTAGGGLSGAFGAMSAGHLVERVGLFVVIALGESVLTTVTTLADSFTPASGTAALAGFATITVLAGDYYLRGSPGAARVLDLAERTRAAGAIRDSVMYLPFLLLSGIAVLAAALGTAVTEPLHTLPPGALWALCGGLLAFHTANAALSLRFGDRPRALLSWYPLCPVLDFGVLYPAGLVLPAWATVAVAALLIGGHLWLTSRPRRQRRH
ncbi:low temperature requirement protein A [Streptomyces qinzhouensis]|uniref:low temperature requirement protein A n=1 Tax=Streptomyces qinzhouensis TaxID=2599401 RepID=UPI0016464B70|nr:low temperature requirement protein A [Streptomyces qinzhouensis]